MNKNKTPGIHMGSSSMLVIFLILCLAILSVLSLSTATSDARLTEQLANRTTSYYKACNQAQITLGELDRMFANSYDGDANSYYANIKNQLEQYQAEDMTISYGRSEDSNSENTVELVIPITQKQALNVVIELTDPGTSDVYYVIDKWQKVSTSEWEGDNSLHLIDIP